eukprot:gene19713-23583_t
MEETDPNANPAKQIPLPKPTAGFGAGMQARNEAQDKLFAPTPFAEAMKESGGVRLRISVVFGHESGDRAELSGDTGRIKSGRSARGDLLGTSDPVAKESARLASMAAQKQWQEAQRIKQLEEAERMKREAAEVEALKAKSIKSMEETVQQSTKTAQELRQQLDEDFKKNKKEQEQEFQRWKSEQMSTIQKELETFREGELEKESRMRQEAQQGILRMQQQAEAKLQKQVESQVAGVKQHVTKACEKAETFFRRAYRHSMKEVTSTYKDEVAMSINKMEDMYDGKMKEKLDEMQILVPHEEEEEYDDVMERFERHLGKYGETDERLAAMGLASAPPPEPTRMMRFTSILVNYGFKFLGVSCLVVALLLIDRGSGGAGLSQMSRLETHRPEIALLQSKVGTVMGKVENMLPEFQLQPEARLPLFHLD